MNDGDARTALLSHTALENDRVRLRPFQTSDYPFLYELETRGEMGIMYRHRGTSIQPDEYRVSMWNGVLVQYLVESKETRAPLGYVTAYAADMRNGHARIAAALDPAAWRLGWPLEGFSLFIDYLFRVFPFRKLYGDSLEFNFQRYSSVTLGVREEGRYRQHEFLDGQWYDKVVLAIYREEWTRIRADPQRSRLLAALKEAS